MTYAQNSLILASDYNSLRTSVANVYGVGFGNTGYGQTAISLPAVAGGNVQPVSSLEWTRLRSAIDVCSQHQGVSVNLPTTPQISLGSVIHAHPPAAGDFPGSVSTITTYRFSYTGTRTTYVTNVARTFRTTLWTTQVYTEIQFQWPTADQCRYFFNSGGQLFFRSSRSGGTATTQNNVMTNFLAGLGLIYMSHSSTESTSGTGTGSSIGYYQLTATNQLIYTKPIAVAPFATLGNVRVYARRVETSFGPNGDNGRTIIVRYELNGNGTSQITGTTSVIADWRIATGILSVTQPTPSIVVDIAAT